MTANVLALPQVGKLKTVSPMAMIKRNMNIKLSKSFLERVKHQTEADSDLQLKLQRQAMQC